MGSPEDIATNAIPLRASSQGRADFLKRVLQAARTVSLITLPLFLPLGLLILALLPLASSLVGALLAIVISVLAIMLVNVLRGLTVNYFVYRSLRRYWSDLNSEIARHGYADGASAPVQPGMCVRHKIGSWWVDTVTVRNHGSNRWSVSIQEAPWLPLIILLSPLFVLILPGLIL